MTPPIHIRHPSERWGLRRRATSSAARDPSVLWDDGMVWGAMLFLALASPAFADPTMPPDPLAYSQLADPAEEARAASLMQTLRCVVCQGQSIADSDADLAGDMRALVRHRIAAGEKPEDIRHWLVQRYGGWVSYSPAIEPLTWPLWIAPVALVALGLWLSRTTLRRRRR